MPFTHSAYTLLIKKGDFMKLTSMRTLVALSLCLLTPALVAGKKSNVHWEDQPEKRVLVVTNTNPSGPGSLRRAVDKANKCHEIQTEIKFCLSKKDPNFNAVTGTWLICIDKPLVITAPDLLIDGLTQKGSLANTEVLENPNNAVLKVEVAPCAQAGVASAQVKVQAVRTATILPIDTIVVAPSADGLLLRGLIVHGSSTPGTAAIRIQSKNSIVDGSFVGTDATGTLPDGTVTAVAVEGDNNTIGRTPPASRMLIGGTGSTTVGALTFTGTNNSLINSTVGLTKNGSAALNKAAAIGIFVNIPASNEALEDLTIDTVAVAGFNESNIQTVNFDTFSVTNTSIGTDITQSFAITTGIGNGLVADSTSVISGDVRGDLTLSNSVISGNNFGLLLGSNSLVPINSVTVTTSSIGTNGEATQAIGNVVGAQSQNIQSLDVSNTTISGNTSIGWHLNSDTLTVPNETILFNSDGFGVGGDRTSPIPNNIGLQISTSNLVQLTNDIIEFNIRNIPIFQNGIGIAASRTANFLPLGPTNAVKNNTINVLIGNF